MAEVFDRDGNDEGSYHPDTLITCWCGARGTAAELFDTSVFSSGPCDGLGVLYCMCGGDLCVCHHHGGIDCPGCEDCRADGQEGMEDHWDDSDYDDEQGD